MRRVAMRTLAVVVAVAAAAGCGEREEQSKYTCFHGWRL